MSVKKLVILDRDGVINSMVVNPDHGTVDSPLHVSQLEIKPGAIEAILLLHKKGYTCSIASNQPAARYGKTTRANLEEVHSAVLKKLSEAGCVISSSHVCWHASQDGCSCRKPKPGLLLEALKFHGVNDPSQAWMVGDGITDVQAAIAAGVKPAFVGPQKCDVCKVMQDQNLAPHYWGKDLFAFANEL